MIFRYVCTKCGRTFVDAEEKHDQCCWKCGEELFCVTDRAFQVWKDWKNENRNEDA